MVYSVLCMCCRGAAVFILDGAPAHIMMLNAREIQQKIDDKLTAPKYHEILQLDDDQAKKKRE